MTNRPRDLYNLLSALDHPLARSFFSFAKRYCAATNNGYGLDTDGASNLEELSQVMAGVMLRRAKSEALDLPVVPIALNSGTLLPKKGPKKPGVVTIRIGEVIPPGLPRKEAEARVHEAINALNA